MKPNSSWELFCLLAKVSRQLCKSIEKSNCILKYQINCRNLFIPSQFLTAELIKEICIVFVFNAKLEACWNSFVFCFAVSKVNELCFLIS